MKKYLFLIIMVSVLVMPILVMAQILPPQEDPTVPRTIPGQISPFPKETEPAQSSGGSFLCSLNSNPKLGDLISYVTCIISKSVIPLIFALAVGMFLWGVVQYIMGAQEEAKREKGRNFMIWGIIALAVMVSIWGLVSILGNTFNIDTKFVPQVRVQ